MATRIIERTTTGVALTNSRQENTSARKSKRLNKIISSFQILSKKYSQDLRVVYQTKKGTLGKVLTLPTPAYNTEKQYVKDEG